MKSANDVVNSVKEFGYDLVENVFDDLFVNRIREQLSKHTSIHNSSVNDIRDIDMVYNCHEKSIDYLVAIQHSLIDEALSLLLGDSYIIYAFQSSSLPPGGTNYARRIHCDSPRLIPNYITNVGLIITLDDYNDDTGPIEFLPLSHHYKNPPTSEFFDKNKVVLKCKKGSVILFNARCYHREGINKANIYRHSLTTNFCRCYMKQRIDFVRMAQASGLILDLTDSQRKLIGYNSRIPTSMDEFFLPPQKRLYQSGQE